MIDMSSAQKYLDKLQYRADKEKPKLSPRYLYGKAARQYVIPLFDTPNQSAALGLTTDHIEHLSEQFKSHRNELEGLFSILSDQILDSFLGVENTNPILDIVEVIQSDQLSTEAKFAGYDFDDLDDSESMAIEFIDRFYSLRQYYPSRENVFINHEAALDYLINYSSSLLYKLRAEGVADREGVIIAIIDKIFDRLCDCIRYGVKMHRVKVWREEQMEKIDSWEWKEICEDHNPLSPTGMPDRKGLVVMYKTYREEYGMSQTLAVEETFKWMESRGLSFDRTKEVLGWTLNKYDYDKARRYFEREEKREKHYEDWKGRPDIL